MINGTAWSAEVSRDSRKTKFLLLRTSSQGRISGSQRRLRFLLHWLSQPPGFKVSGHERQRGKASCRVLEKRNSLRAGYYSGRTSTHWSSYWGHHPAPSSSNHRHIRPTAVETGAHARVIRARRYAGIRSLSSGEDLVAAWTSAARSLSRLCMRILNNWCVSRTERKL